MQAYIRHQQHQHFKHQDIKQKEPPQKYRLGYRNRVPVFIAINEPVRMTERHDLIVGLAVTVTTSVLASSICFRKSANSGH